MLIAVRTQMKAALWHKGSTSAVAQPKHEEILLTLVAIPL